MKWGCSNITRYFGTTSVDQHQFSLSAFRFRFIAVKSFLCEEMICLIKTFHQPLCLMEMKYLPNVFVQAQVRVGDLVSATVMQRSQKLKKNFQRWPFLCWAGQGLVKFPKQREKESNSIHVCTTEEKEPFWPHNSGYQNSHV